MAKLYFYYSSMNAGKSTVLLQSSYNYRERGMHTLMFTPAVDNRAGVGRIESRIGLAGDRYAGFAQRRDIAVDRPLADLEMSGQVRGAHESAPLQEHHHRHQSVGPVHERVL